MKDSVTIDSVKVLCIILAEHEKLYNENSLLLNKISLLEDLNNNYSYSDSLQHSMITECEQRIKSDSEKIAKLENYKKKSFFIGGSFGLILFLLGIII